MTTMQSLVLGAVSQNLSGTRLLKVVPSQEFVRDEVLVTPSLDPYLRIVHANEVLLSGKSLALEASKKQNAVSLSVLSKRA
jgi:hypothetical protein